MQKKIDKLNKICYNTEVEKRYAPLPQLDRGLGYEPRRQGFESLKARQKKDIFGCLFSVMFNFDLERKNENE